MCAVIPFEADNADDLIACIEWGDCLHLDRIAASVFTKPEEDRIASRVAQAYKKWRAQQILKKERKCNLSASPSI